VGQSIIIIIIIIKRAPFSSSFIFHDTTMTSINWHWYGMFPNAVRSVLPFRRGNYFCSTLCWIMGCSLLWAGL